MLRRFARGLSWGFVGSLFTQGSTFAVNLVAANLLGREIFGEFAVTQTTAVITLQVAQLACGYTATKYLAEFRTKDPGRAGRILTICGFIAVIMSCLAALALIAGSTILATHVLRVPALWRALRWSGAIVLFGVNSGFLTGALIGLEEYRALGISNIFAGASYAVACVVGALKNGFDGALEGLVLAYFAQTLALAWAMRGAIAKHHLELSLRTMSRERDIVVRFTLPAAISGMSALPAIWLATAALVRTAHGLDEVAIYTAAFNLRIAAMFLPNIVNNVGLAILNNERGHGTPASYRKAFWTNWLSVVGSAFIVAGALAFLAPVALRLFGRGFVAGSPVAHILLASAVVEAVSLATSQVLQNRERLWLNLFTYALPRDVALVSLAFVLSPRYGAVGLAFGYFVAQSISAALVAVVVSRIGIHPSTTAERG